MQQVNLYSEELRPQTELLTAEKSLGVLVALVLIIIVLSVLKTREFNLLDETATLLEEKSEALKATSKDLKNKPATVIKEDIDREIKAARAALKNRKNIETLLSGKNMGNKEGFSQYFKAISESVPQSVSINQFSLLQSGNLASFAGESQKIESIPLFFDNLHKQSSFEKTRFGSLEIEKSGAIHTFSIGPTADDKTNKLVRK